MHARTDDVRKTTQRVAHALELVAQIAVLPQLLLDSAMRAWIPSTIAPTPVRPGSQRLASGHCPVWGAEGPQGG